MGTDGFFLLGEYFLTAQEGGLVKGKYYSSVKTRTPCLASGALHSKSMKEEKAMSQKMSVNSHMSFYKLKDNIQITESFC